MKALFITCRVGTVSFNLVPAKCTVLALATLSDTKHGWMDPRAFQKQACSVVCSDPQGVDSKTRPGTMKTHDTPMSARDVGTTLSCEDVRCNAIRRDLRVRPSTCFVCA